MSSFTPSRPTQPPELEPADLPVERGSIVRWRLFAIAMLLAGAALVEAVLAAPSVTTSAPVLAHGAAALMLGLSILVALVDATALFRILTRVVIVTSIVAITALVASVQGIAMTPIFYVWPLLGAVYLLPRLELIGITVLTAASYGGGLAVSPAQPFPTVDFLLTLLVGIVTVVAVRLLSENIGLTIGSLRHSSATDPLTSLLNRRGFEERFHRHFHRAAADDLPITTMLLDIDHFKAINDAFGHPVGDVALKRFAVLLERSCRASDLVARVGGEEFAVVMPGATLDQAIARAQQFCSILREDRSIRGVVMTASAGIVPREPATDGWEAMLVAADAAVYEAKRQGRDRIVVAGPARPQSS